MVQVLLTINTHILHPLRSLPNSALTTTNFILNRPVMPLRSTITRRARFCRGCRYETIVEADVAFKGK